MELRYISEFLTLAELRNYSDAADKLFVSQSSLTRHIQSLEDELGAPLFDKLGRSIRLSIYGERFAQYAEKLVRLNDECVSDIHSMRASANNVITIGVIPAKSYYGIVEYLADFQRNNELYTLNIVEADTVFLSEMVQNGLCDFAFVRGTEQSLAPFDRVDILDEELAVLVSKRSWLFSRESVSFKELEQERFIMLDKRSFLYQYLLDECRKAGFEPKVSLYASRAITRQMATERGDGVMLLPKQSGIHYLTDNMYLLRLEPPLRQKLSLIYSRERELSQAARTFLGASDDMITRLREKVGER